MKDSFLQLVGFSLTNQANTSCGILCCSANLEVDNPYASHALARIITSYDYSMQVEYLMPTSPSNRRVVAGPRCSPCLVCRSLNRLVALRMLQLPSRDLSRRKKAVNGCILARTLGLDGRQPTCSSRNHELLQMSVRPRVSLSGREEIDPSLHKRNRLRA